MREKDYFICPDADKCVVYKNWVKKTKDKRINIIQRDGNGYHCLALTAIEDPVSEGGIRFDADTQSRIDENAVKENIGVRDTQCAKIETMNLLRQLIPREKAV